MRCRSFVFVHVNAAVMLWIFYQKYSDTFNLNTHKRIRTFSQEEVGWQREKAGGRGGGGDTMRRMDNERALTKKTWEFSSTQNNQHMGYPSHFKRITFHTSILRLHRNKTKNKMKTNKPFSSGTQAIPFHSLFGESFMDDSFAPLLAHCVCMCVGHCTSISLGCALCEWHCTAGMRAAGLAHSHMIHSLHIFHTNFFLSFLYFFVHICFFFASFPNCVRLFCENWFSTFGCVCCSLACCLFKQNAWILNRVCVCMHEMRNLCHQPIFLRKCAFQPSFISCVARKRMRLCVFILFPHQLAFTFISLWPRVCLSLRKHTHSIHIQANPHRDTHTHSQRGRVSKRGRRKW